MRKFVDNHLQRFLACSEPHQEWPWAKNVRAWAGAVDETLNAALNLPDKRLGRRELRAFCSDTSATSDEECFLSIMAWGGMRLTHGRKAWGARANWLSTLRTVRRDSLDRKRCYEQFAALRRAGKLPCVRPAYFTKLLFFARPNDDAYIMDQWTAKSVNLLVGEPLVDLTSGYVTDRNSAEIYEEFCRSVEDLASLANCSPADAEKRLFSLGGRNPAPWRSHVRSHWRRIV